jgi:type III secretory pathway component EscR
MVILIKRFPVIKSIENVKGSLDLAQFYNQKEEDILEKENKDYYTSQIQVQIAKCEEQKIILDSNFRIISFFRMSGLLCFFSVLLIATMMINFYFFVISTIIVSYVFIASRMMEENKLLKYFILDKKGKQRQTKNQRKFK